MIIRLNPVLSPFFFSLVENWPSLSENSTIFFKPFPKDWVRILSGFLKSKSGFILDLECFRPEIKWRHCNGHCVKRNCVHDAVEMNKQYLLMIQ